MELKQRLLEAESGSPSPAEHVGHDVQRLQLHGHVFLLGDGARQPTRYLLADAGGQSGTWWRQSRCCLRSSDTVSLTEKRERRYRWRLAATLQSQF